MKKGQNRLLQLQHNQPSKKHNHLLRKLLHLCNRPLNIGGTQSTHLQKPVVLEYASHILSRSSVTCFLRWQSWWQNKNFQISMGRLCGRFPATWRPEMGRNGFSKKKIAQIIAQNPNWCYLWPFHGHEWFWKVIACGTSAWCIISSRVDEVPSLNAAHMADKNQ